MALVITKKTRTILLIVLGVLVVGGGGFLFWRINQEDTVAPEDSEAGVICPDDCIRGGQSGDNYCVNDQWVTTMPDCVKPAPCKSGTGWKSCTPISGGGSDYDCTCDCGTDKKPGVNGSCKWETVCVPTYGNCGCYGWGDDNGSCYSVTYNPNGGTCTRTSYSPQQKDTITPSCSRSGYTITGYSKTSGSCGNLNTSTGVLTNVTCNLTITVNWTPKTYTVKYTAGEHGSIEGSKTQTVNHGASATAVKAVPDTGYFFGGWSDGKATASRTDTNVIKNITVSASFSILCGNNACDPDENANSCPVDCEPECGDNYCTHDETALTCPDDCDSECGDNYCTHDENAQTCPDDCDPDCGDGLCTGDETPLTCPADCDSECGDELCTQGEDSNNCPADCDSVCGDGYCTGGEDSSNCSEDCGEPPIQSGTVPQTGVFDTVLGRVSVGVSFIFLGGLVTQYSRFNYFFNSMSQRYQFKKEVKRQRRKEERMAKRRKKLEKRFK